MPDPDLDQLNVFDPDAKSDPEEQFPEDPTEEVEEFAEAERYGGSSWRSQGYYGNPNDAENRSTTAKPDQSVPSGQTGISSADDDPLSSPHPIESRGDTEIQEDIAAYLRQHTEADMSNIDFEVMAGTVVLKGEADERTQEIVELTVRGIAGVHRIENQIQNPSVPRQQ